MPEENSPKKGEHGGECARRVCSTQPATYYNTSTRQYYCAKCAKMINKAAEEFGDPQLCSEVKG